MLRQDLLWVIRARTTRFGAVKPRRPSAGAGTVRPSEGSQNVRGEEGGATEAGPPCDLSEPAPRSNMKAPPQRRTTGPTSSQAPISSQPRRAVFEDGVPDPRTGPPSPLPDGLAPPRTQGHPRNSPPPNSSKTPPTPKSAPLATRQYLVLSSQS